MGPDQKEISLTEGLGIKQAMKEAKNSRDYRRLQSVYLRYEGHEPEDISSIVGYTLPHIRKIWTRYFKSGIEGVLSPRNGGRYHFYLTPEEELALLEKYARRAGKGHVIEIAPLHEAYCEAVGHEVALSTTYRMVHRHGWRKIAPRPHHPKRNAKAAEYFKVFFSAAA